MQWLAVLTTSASWSMYWQLHTQQLEVKGLYFTDAFHACMHVCNILNEYTNLGNSVERLNQVVWKFCVPASHIQFTAESHPHYIPITALLTMTWYRLVTYNPTVLVIWQSVQNMYAACIWNYAWIMSMYTHSTSTYNFMMLYVYICMRMSVFT